MATDWKSSVLERTAHMLGPRYKIVGMEEDAEGGYVRFDDPAMLRKEWTGPIYGGIVRYSKAEILGLESSPGRDSKIREKVEAAKDVLLEQVSAHRRDEMAILKRLALRLSLTLLVVYPLAGRIF